MNIDSNEQYAPKVGRHRVFSNEQRRDRNRKAQAAFRDRRNKYTNTLETAIVGFEETIKSLKETNNQSIERAQVAEERSQQLSSEVISLQRLLEMVLADNQRLQAQINVTSMSTSNDMLPLSPNNSSLGSDKMSPSNSIHHIFDDVFTNPVTTTTTTTAAATTATETIICSPVSSSSVEQLELFNSLNNQIITGESLRLKAAI
ncbi:hypothetical protein INT46_000199 [Mucor plumbeus]|uniref:BZIP domain-containing protein n=1 Tax=Mucor plumbeus TaxID=97098 RepID=A0A8H7QWM9_9FUNG|nr:hypothetical protein INT46_000199 [Mucor plumbeus]